MRDMTKGEAMDRLVHAFLDLREERNVEAETLRGQVEELGGRLADLRIERDGAQAENRSLRGELELLKGRPMSPVITHAERVALKKTGIFPEFN